MRCVIALHRQRGPRRGHEGMKRPEPAKAVVKTMNILECLSKESSLGVTELARRVTGFSGTSRLHKSTVYRFLSSLKELGYVRQDPETERYSLTPKLFEIGTAVLDRLELWQEAQPVVKRLAQLTGETVHLATLDNRRLVYLTKLESTRTLRVSMMSRVGQSAPTHCTGLGKALLAYAPGDQVNAMLAEEKLVRFTERTITNRSRLCRELENIRSQGFAVDNEEHEVGVKCVAAPVRDNTGRVIAAVSISVPAVRLKDKDIPRLSRIVVKGAQEISSRLGHAADRRRPNRRGSR